MDVIEFCRFIRFDWNGIFLLAVENLHLHPLSAQPPACLFAGFQEYLLIFGVLHIFIRGFPEISHRKFELLRLDFAIFPESIPNFLQHPAFLRHLFQMNRNVVIIVKAESFHPVSYLHTPYSSRMNCS